MYKWAKTWSYSGATAGGDIIFGPHMWRIVLATAYLAATTHRWPATAQLKSLFIYGDMGVGKSMLSKLITGHPKRTKRLITDSTGVGRFKLITGREAIFWCEDVKLDQFTSCDNYSTLIGIMDANEVEIKIHSRTQQLPCMWLVATVNDTISDLLQTDREGIVQYYENGEPRPHQYRRRMIEIKITEKIPEELADFASKNYTEDGGITAMWQEIRRKLIKNKEKLPKWTWFRYLEMIDDPIVNLKVAETEVSDEDEEPPNKRQRKESDN